MSTQMRAITQRTLGGPDVLELVETERPAPAPGEVLVRVGAAGVNPADWKIREGIVRRFGDPPFTLGLDFAGVVADAGTRPDLRLGDRVFGCVFPPRGSYAEYVVAPVAALASVPAGIDTVRAAALPVAALTAWQPLVRVAAIRPGQRVLVHAAAGGIGHLAVQVAKLHGAHVIATARAANHRFLADLGADEVVDYTACDFTTAIDDVDVVLDPISGEYGLRSLDTLRPSGTLIDIRGTGPDRTAIRERARQRGLRYVEFGFTPSAEDLRAIARLVDDGRLRVAVEHVRPLREAADAHRGVQTNHGRGKTVLVVDHDQCR